MVFGCISKNFPENIFWCMEKKKENTNPEKHKPQPREKSSTTTNPVRRPRRRSRSIPVFGSFKYFYKKCIKSGKRNQNPAKENESPIVREERAQIGAMRSSGRRAMTSDAISSNQNPRQLAMRSHRSHRAIPSIALVDRAAHRRNAIVRRAARSTIGALRSELSLLSLSL